MIYALLSQFITLILLSLVVLDFKVTHKKIVSADLLLWGAIVYFLSVIGFILYVLVGRKQIMQRQNTQTQNQNITQIPPQSSDTDQQLVNTQNQQVTTANNPVPTLSNASKTIGSLLTIIAAVMGFGVVASFILIAILFYGNSSPGAKSM